MSDPLISVGELVERLDEVVLFDLRWSLTDSSQGKGTYAAGHIPGAFFVDLDTDLTAAVGEGR
ncbi:MAG: sulfurtransferase, partial [Acidimicrobiia bacterium]